jgi:hypothetical protein
VGEYDLGKFGIKEINMDKKQILKRAIEKFDKSDKGLMDYLEFSYIINYCTKQGSGLAWLQVIDIYKEVLHNTK